MPDGDSELATAASQSSAPPPGAPNDGGARSAEAAATRGAALPHASVLHLLLRRLRVPLLFVTVVFAISVAGFTLVPGVDADGRPSPPLSFFHAFYFVTYTATTIGFGEVPVAFSDAQRMWAIVIIYLSVIAWTYTLLTALAAVQDVSFVRAIAAIRFERRVRSIAEPFLMVLGCGDTGLRLTRVFDRLGMRFVVVEIDPARLQALELEDFRNDIVAIQGDASRPQTLLRAGLRHPCCRAVLALTNDDAANVAAVITASLLNPRATMIARSHTAETATLMQASGTARIVDPFLAFAEQLAMALRAPGCYRLFDWLTALRGTPLARELAPPPAGTWIVCGYGRFGRAVAQRLREHGADVRVIEPTPQADADDDIEVIVGDGTRRAVLERAGIATAQSIVVGTSSDLRNLAIARLAQSINGSLFVVLRQNEADNAVLFENFRADLVMRPSEIVADECVALLTSPLLVRFLGQVRRQTDAWADRVIHRLRDTSGKQAPATWEVRIDREQAPALCEHGVAPPAPASRKSAGDGDGPSRPTRDDSATRPPLRLGDLLRDPHDRSRRIEATALLVLRSGRETLLPTDDWKLAEADELLFAGREAARRFIEIGLHDRGVLDYLVTGREPGRHWPWQRSRRAA
ncbi:MAG: potassium channel family protein [Burkholderiaceae bacterium]|nr:potassium channel family protein [Burkholderiaceae bacterium]